MSKEQHLTRRSSLKTLGAAGAVALLGEGAGTIGASEPPRQATEARGKIFDRVWHTPLIDTHEHLCEEKDRLSGDGLPEGQVNDWTAVLAHYFDSDLLSAGMPEDVQRAFFGGEGSPTEKWKLLAPYWPAVKNTGYGKAVRITLRELYGVDELSVRTVRQVQAGYENLVKPGYYRHVLCDLAKIESCQVNCLTAPFSETEQPTLLMQDLSIVGMLAGPAIDTFGKPTGIQVSGLSDWHRVIDWWFDRYGRYAVAVKSQNAYQRDIDYARVEAETVEPVFRAYIEGRKLAVEEKKALEDHLFWYAVEKSTACGLPVKLHLGYYAGNNRMPLSRLMNNPGSACELCKASPDTRFVLMHIAYPYYEPLIALAKHYTNAYVDMCWAWICNPVAAKDFLKKYLVSAPANKILTFGGDYRYVEPVLGHALITRHGIATALSELVEEGWLGLDDALELVDPIMHGNARQIFEIDEKMKVLQNVPW